MRLGLLLSLGLACMSVACTNQVEEATGGTGESQDQLLAGRKVPQAELAQILRDAGFPESVIPAMVCTAKWESSFYERASHTNSNGTSDFGLFQINSIHLGARGCPRSASAVFDATTNAKCALGIYDAQGLNAWYGYKAHRAECDAYTVPGDAGAAVDTGPVGCHSGTLGTRVDALTCVESKFDKAWYQCVDGGWSAGGASGTGPGGACAASYPLS